MEVILLKKVEKLGGENEVVAVKPGYARNYLIPNKLALIANDTNKRILGQRIKQAGAREEKLREEMTAISAKLAKSSVKIGAKAGKENKIFGSITTLQLSDAINKQLGIEIDRRNISFYEEVKTLGTFKANLNLHKDVQVEMNFEVVEE